MQITTGAHESTGRTCRRHVPTRIFAVRLIFSSCHSCSFVEKKRRTESGATPRFVSWNGPRHPGEPCSRDTAPPCPDGGEEPSCKCLLAQREASPLRAIHAASWKRNAAQSPAQRLGSCRGVVHDTQVNHGVGTRLRRVLCEGSRNFLACSHQSAAYEYRCRTCRRHVATRIFAVPAHFLFVPFVQLRGKETPVGTGCNASVCVVEWSTTPR
jgi:hypothetical protein